MAWLGREYRGQAPDEATSSLDQLSRALSTEHGPGHRDRATYTDEAGYTNVITIAYWEGAEDFDAWFKTGGGDWTGDDRAHDGVGYFTEVLRPRMQDFKTLFWANNRPEGIAVVPEDMSDIKLPHAYAPPARAPIPRPHTDELAARGS